MNFLLIPLFAILNRFRGADGFTIIGKVALMIALFIILFPEWWLGGIAATLYLIGQSVGWGWWIGEIIEAPPSKTSPSDSGIREVLSHNISKFIFPKKDIWYNRMALALIGLVWWFPVLLCFNINLMTIVSSLLCSIGFPLSFEIAKRLPKLKWSLLDHPWGIGEFIYGAFTGLAIYLLI